MDSVKSIENSRKNAFRCQIGLFGSRRRSFIVGLYTIFSISLIFLGTSSVIGQDNASVGKDSLISNNGTVFTGHYNKPVFGHSSFTYNGKKHPLDANQYQAYKHDGTWFKSVQLTSVADPVWMEWLERGPINLYQYVSYGAATRVSPRNLPQSYVVWLAQKKSGPLLNVNGVLSTQEKAKENIHRLLVGQPDLAGELNDAPFNTRMIRGLIAAFNRRTNKGEQ